MTDKKPSSSASTPVPSRLRTFGFGVTCLAAGFAGVSACSDSSLDLPTSGPLSLTLTVAPTDITAGDEVLVTAASVGTLLLGTVIDYGDGFVDSIGASGAQTQTVNCPKAYNEVGVFVVTATVDDAEQGKQIKQDTVRVSAGVDSLPPSPPSACDTPPGT